MSPVGVAILGSGIFVREKHIPAALQDPSLISLKAIYSRSRASADLVLVDTPGIDVYSDDSPASYQLDDLLKREDIQCVIIALPIVAQPDYIKKALLAGKHVLSEKPVAKDLETARDLIRWKEANVPSMIWSVAENFRFKESFKYAREQILSFGRILHFRVSIASMVKPGGKYFETAWRKVPEYQGGFLLDGGVHYTAGLQMLVGDGNIHSLVAFSALLQPHLPPVDTITSLLTLKDGTPGTFSASFGQPSISNFEFIVGCEEGSVTVTGGGNVVSVQKVGLAAEEKSFMEDVTGVFAEVRAFAGAVQTKQFHPQQTPELALKDLELIEKMLLSAQEDGKIYAVTGGGDQGIIKTLANILEG